MCNKCFLGLRVIPTRMCPARWPAVATAGLVSAVRGWERHNSARCSGGPGGAARRRGGGPGIRGARVVASQARAVFSGSRRGDGNTGVSGVSLTGRSFFLVRGSLAAVGGGGGGRA